MSRQESHKRPARARTAVKTYNLKVLTGTTHKRSLNNRAAGPLHERRPSMAKRSDTISRPVTPAERLRRSHSNASSELTSPMPSPSLSLLETSLAHEAARTPERLESANYEAAGDNDSMIQTASADSPSLFACFNTQNHPTGHFYSANELFSRGIWIGYFAPDRYHESFRKLPSFSDLRTNFRQFSAPFPPATPGAAREERKAVCRGCVGDDSAVITLREIPFVHNTKLVVMPLDGDDDAGMFCIMLSQPNDRSLHGLQSYRPYEYLNEGKGTTFDNNFMLLTLRNTSRDIGTLNTVRAVLSTDELNRAKRHTPKRPRVDSRHGSAPIAPLTIPILSPPTPATYRPSMENSNEAIKDSGHKQNTESLSAHNSPQSKGSDVGSDHISPTRHEHTHVPISQPQEHMLTSPEANEPSQKAPAATNPTKVISLDLTDEQARRVYIVWTVNDDGLDYEFVHTIDECKSFDGLLRLLQEDTEAIPSVAMILVETKMWSLTYQLTDRTRKAIVTRKGTEVAFDRLQATLAQSSIWTDNSYVKVDIELTALSRAIGSAPAM